MRNARPDDQARRDRVASEAAQVLHDPARLIILDTETTGVHGLLDEVVELALLNGQGQVLFTSLIHLWDDQRAADDLATHIHGITRDELALAPPFPLVWAEVLPLLSQAAHIVTYNMEFDRRMLYGMLRRYQLPIPAGLPWTCLMQWYSTWFGAWNAARGSFTWQTLHHACAHLGIAPTLEQEPSHRAVSDARAALEVLRHLAARVPDA